MSEVSPEITHWNYRVVKHKDMPDWTSDMAIHEAYYEDDGGISITENPTPAWGSTIDELREVLGCMLLALDKPILDENGKELQSEPSKITYPVDKSIPIYHGFKWGGNHVGVDWIVPVGTPIPSIKDGEVIESAQDSKTYGGYVLIEHDDGYASLYAHLSKLNVKRGDVVKAGDIIGLSGGVPGTPGAGASTGYHLHFEIRPPGQLNNNQHNIDPIEYLNNIGDMTNNNGA